MSVLVVGTVAFDSIEAPAGSVERILGGSASYFALAASYFAPVRMVGVIGQDFPQDHLDLFTQRGIDIAGIKREQGDTFHWRGRYHEDINQRDTIELHLNVLAGFKPKLPESYRDAEYGISRQYRSGHTDGCRRTDSPHEASGVRHHGLLDPRE